ncbi:MAG: glycogen synthase GlgA [Bauldia sp.]
MRVLAVASEVFPLIKTGGLADVVGALPRATHAHGVEMRVMVPGYPVVMAALANGEIVHRFAGLQGGDATLIAGTARGLDLLVLDAPHLFDRPGSPYLGPDGADWPDNWRRFAALAFAAAEVGRGRVAAFAPDIVHCHDWQAALAAVYLRFGGEPRAKSIVTIHNLAFQGNFGPTVFAGLGLPPAAFAIDGVEYYGGVGYLKGGLQLADAITTVSPTYAREICTPEGGMGLDGLLRARRDALSGILNGADTDVWDPETDANLTAAYSAQRLKLRALNKRAVEDRFALKAGDGPLFCVVSRLTWQKGIDILAACVDLLVGLGARFAILGSGDAALEGLIRAAAARHRGQVAMISGYDEPLSHLLQGGADAIVVPSRFEPCGLTQFYGLRYGCVPIVARVGGLADSIIDANDAALSAGVATGLQFLPVEVAALEAALVRALELYRDPRAWQVLQKRGMKSDVSWGKSSRQYADLYRRLAGPAGG